MQPPFTTEQFLDVFRLYNEAVWPAQAVIYVLVIVMVVQAARGESDRWVGAGLALLWGWMGVAYHWAFFTRINPAAWLFGGVFLLGAAAFLVEGVVRRRLRFRFEPDGYGVAGGAFLAYALVLYPLLGAAAGHPFPHGPTLGLPCPTTIATFGLLLWASRPVPLTVLVVPAAWSVVGGVAAFRFGVPEDYGLLVAGVVGTALLVARRRRLGGERTPPVTPPP